MKHPTILYNKKIIKYNLEGHELNAMIKSIWNYSQNYGQIKKKELVVQVKEIRLRKVQITGEEEVLELIFCPIY